MGRLGAALYDPLTEQNERAGLAELRRELLAVATGTVVELGAGTGRNVEHYPASVERLVLVEPDTAMARRIGAKAARAPFPVEVVAARAERLPFPDRSVDTAVSTLVLCSVDDVGAVLAEIGRVLRPEGRFLFLEHVRARDGRLARRQDRLAPLWSLVAGGCRIDRDTAALIRASPLQLEDIQQATMPGGSLLSLVDPLVVGCALAPGAVSAP